MDIQMGYFTDANYKAVARILPGLEIVEVAYSGKETRGHPVCGGSRLILGQYDMGEFVSMFKYTNGVDITFESMMRRDFSNFEVLRQDGTPINADYSEANNRWYVRGFSGVTELRPEQFYIMYKPLYRAPRDERVDGITDLKNYTLMCKVMTIYGVHEDRIKIVNQHGVVNYDLLGINIATKVLGSEPRTMKQIVDMMRKETEKLRASGEFWGKVISYHVVNNEGRSLTV